MQIIAVIVMIPAILQCFFGYKLLKFWMSFTGFLIGGCIGLLIGLAACGTNSGNAAIPIILSLIFGVLGAWIAFKLYKIGVFLMCFAMGFIFGAILGYFAGGTSMMVPLGVIFAFIAAIAGVILMKPVIIISTSLTGGILAGVCLVKAFGSQNSTVGIVLGILLAALGIYVQFKMNKKAHEQPVPKADNVYYDQRPATVAQQTSQSNISLEAENQSLANDNFDKVAANMAAGATKAFNTVKDSTIKTSAAVMERLKTKVEQDNETAAKKAKGLSFDEVCENLGEIFYKNNVLKYIMPFAEYILYFLAALSVVGILLSGYLYMLSAIYLVCCLLVLAKSKYGALSISLTCFTVAGLIGTVRSFEYQVSFYQFFLLLELALYVLLTILAYKKFFSTDKGISLRQKFAAIVALPKSGTSVIKVRCPICGTLCDETTAICHNCGKELLVQAVQNSTENENFATAAIPEPEKNEEAVFCPQCGHTCNSNDKFCPKCGQDLRSQH
jgi:membrane protease subunit (stomatin/prohibitin family)